MDTQNWVESFVLAMYFVRDWFLPFWVGIVAMAKLIEINDKLRGILFILTRRDGWGTASDDSTATRDISNTNNRSTVGGND